MREEQEGRASSAANGAAAMRASRRPSTSSTFPHASPPAHPQTQPTYTTWRRQWSTTWPNFPWRRQQQKVRALISLPPSLPPSLPSLLPPSNLTPTPCPPPDYDTAEKENGDSSASKGMCAAPGCVKAATMACPKCLALKVPAELGTLFCSQVRGWKEEEGGRQRSSAREKKA